MSLYAQQPVPKLSQAAGVHDTKTRLTCFHESDYTADVVGFSHSQGGVAVKKLFVSVVMLGGVVALATGIWLAGPVGAQPPPADDMPRLPTVPPLDQPPPPQLEPQPLTLEQNIKALKELRAKKAEFEKEEAKAVSAIQKQLAEQKRELDELGIPASPSPILPPSPRLPQVVPIFSPH